MYICSGRGDKSLLEKVYRHYASLYVSKTPWKIITGFTSAQKSMATYQLGTN